jgi:ATP phosphoribosyltransferase regulatory subunit
MPKAWLLPEHTADVLPNQAADVEALRRGFIDVARRSGYELVIPPLVEHIESLLTGAGADLDLRTVKVVDQISGRMLGVRADMTPQAARIDAHLLNRRGPVRLIYCGPVLHARPRGLQSSRDPLQFGAELYGHAGLEADLEIHRLALDGLTLAGLGRIGIDLADVRILDALIGSGRSRLAATADLVAALAAKDRQAVEEAACAATFSTEVQNALAALVGLYGPVDEVLVEAERRLPALPAITLALSELRWMARHLSAVQPDVEVGLDLANLQGFGYYTGFSFAAYAQGHSDALIRGGRYDEIGAVFGRRRAAVGFSVDLKDLASLRDAAPARSAIVAPWGEEIALRDAVARLRARGECVISLLPGQEAHLAELSHDRRLVQVDGQWVVQSA